MPGARGADPSPEASEVYGKEEAQAKILLNLLKTKNPKLLSDISEEELPILVGLGVLSDYLDSDFLKNMRDEFLQFKVSIGRAGRQELVTIALASRYQGGGSGGKSGLKSLLAGIK